jgi:hypothetical protein
MYTKGGVNMAKNTLEYDMIVFEAHGQLPV